MPLGEGQRGGRRKRGRAFQLFQLSAVIPPGTLSHPSCASGQALPLLSADPSGARLTDGSSIPAPPQAVCDSAAGAGQSFTAGSLSARWDPTRVFLDMWRAGRQERGAVKSRNGVRRLTF